MSSQARAAGRRVDSGLGTNAHGSCHFCRKSPCNGESLDSTFSSFSRGTSERSWARQLMTGVGRL